LPLEQLPVNAINALGIAGDGTLGIPLQAQQGVSLSAQRAVLKKRAGLVKESRFERLGTSGCAIGMGARPLAPATQQKG